MSSIQQTPSYLADLHSLIKPDSVLLKHGFVLRELSDEELRATRRCEGCGKSE
jgi:hypothetical protein